MFLLIGKLEGESSFPCKLAGLNTPAVGRHEVVLVSNLVGTASLFAFITRHLI